MLKGNLADALRTARCILQNHHSCLPTGQPLLVSRSHSPHIAKRPFLISLSLYSLSFASDPLL